MVTHTQFGDATMFVIGFASVDIWIWFSTCKGNDQNETNYNWESLQSNNPNLIHIFECSRNETYNGFIIIISLLACKFWVFNTLIIP